VNTPAISVPTVPSVIAVSDLVCGYGDEIILRDINFEVPAGQICFIIGGSGCGKSTLLKNLIGVRRPFAGDVCFHGESFLHARDQTRRELLRSFGVLYQSGALWSSLTVRENVALPLREYTRLSRREIDDLVCLKLSLVNLAGYGDHYPAELSGGMRKRAGLARALALDPRIVFFDEPSAGLDPLLSRQLDELIVSLRDTLGTTCVIVSHELDSIFSIADRVLMLDKEAQTIIADGPAAELRDGTNAPARHFLTRGASAPA
jgi:phospholipid/cholesterol/gamma-HCH transport system ATP-binding protein